MEEQITCGYTGRTVNKSRCVDGFTIRPQIFELIQQRKPSFTRKDWIMKSVLKEFKLEYADRLLGDHELAVAVRDHEVISDDIARSLEYKAPMTQIDYIANFASGKGFLIFLGNFILWWVLLNINGSFDAYPYNLLDLVLGVMVTVQSVFIMMSQAKSAEQDKQRMIHSLRLSLKNELEQSIIREKIDHIKDIQIPYLLEKVKGK